MPAYSREIFKHKCRNCPKPATHEVYNTHNALNGYFCKRHAEEYVKVLNNG